MYQWLSCSSLLGGLHHTRAKKQTIMWVHLTLCTAQHWSSNSVSLSVLPSVRHSLALCQTVMVVT